MASLEDIKSILIDSQQMWAQAHKELINALKTKSTGTKTANEKNSSGGGLNLPDMSGMMPQDMRQMFSQFSTTLKQIFGGTNLAKFENTLKLTLGQLVGQAGGSAFKRMLGTAAGAAAGAAAGGRFSKFADDVTFSKSLIQRTYAPVRASILKKLGLPVRPPSTPSDDDDDQPKSRWSQFRDSLFRQPSTRPTSFGIRRWLREGMNISQRFSGEGPLGAMGHQYRTARTVLGEGSFSAAAKAPFRVGGRAISSGFSAARAAGSAAWAGRAAGVMGAARGGIAALGAGASAGGGTAMAALGLSNPVGWAVLAATAIPAAIAALAGFSNALYKSQEHLKEFSGSIARTFAKSEIREFKRNLASARNRETVTGWLGSQTEQFKDNMRPVWDTLFNIMGSILAAIMLIINTIMSMIGKVMDGLRWVWNALPNLITGGKKMEDPDKKKAEDLGPLGNMLREFGMGRSDKWQDKTLFNWGGI